MSKRKAKAPVDEAPPLVIAAADGTELIAFAPEAAAPYRAMIARLVRDGQLPKIVSFVAAVREEGVTYSTVAFAATLATDLADSVCVVEVNWHWPGQAAMLNSAPSSGLAALLTGNGDLETLVIKTALPNLALLPAGDLPIDQRPVIARSETLKHVIHELSEKFDHVVLDIPAVLATSDAIPLAALGEACVLIVRQGVTPKSKAQAALDDVKQLPMLGVVLNRVKLKTPRLLRKLIPQT